MSVSITAILATNENLIEGPEFYGPMEPSLNGAKFKEEFSKVNTIGEFEEFNRSISKEYFRYEEDEEDSLAISSSPIKKVMTPDSRVSKQYFTQYIRSQWVVLKNTSDRTLVLELGIEVAPGNTVYFSPYEQKKRE